MQKIDNPAFLSLVETCDRIHELEEKLADLREIVREQTRALDQIQDGATRLSAINFAYWFLQETKVKDLTWALLKKTHATSLLPYISAKDLGVICDSCGGTVEIYSRTQARALYYEARAKERTGRQTSIRCDECKAKQRVADAFFFEERDSKRALRFSQLKRMPYKEYLHTEDCKIITRNFLATKQYIAGKYETLTCETCANTRSLHVFHKPNFVQGREKATDMILLCPACYTLMSRTNRVLAREARE